MSAVNDLHDDESSESKYNDVGQYLQMNDKKWCEENLAKNRFATADNVFTFIKGKVENSDKRFTRKKWDLRNLQIGMLISSPFDEDVDSLKDDFLVLKLKKPKSSVRMWSIFHDRTVQGVEIGKIVSWEEQFTKALHECADMDGPI